MSSSSSCLSIKVSVTTVHRGDVLFGSNSQYLRNREVVILKQCISISSTAMGPDFQFTTFKLMAVCYQTKGSYHGNSFIAKCSQHPSSVWK
jgi:hypothetical protein